MIAYIIIYFCLNMARLGHSLIPKLIYTSSFIQLNSTQVGPIDYLTLLYIPQLVFFSQPQSAQECPISMNCVAHSNLVIP